MHLARFIADLEEKPNERWDITFVSRFDCAHDPKTVAYVGQKFGKVHLLTGRRQATGWPAGCNELALDLFSQSNDKTLRGQWDYKALYLIEADVMPLRRDWLEKLEEEWDMAAKNGKFVLGAWCPFHSPFGHINGNMLVAPDLRSRVTGIDHCPPKSGWDAYLAPKFAPHWQKSRIMQNHYDYRADIPPEILWSSVDGKTEPVVVHGVKDMSAENQVKERLGL
jgi:hypothetical protein